MVDCRGEHLLIVLTVDPNLIDSNDGDGLNGLKLAFGSYWNGIYQVGLWPDVKTRASVRNFIHDHRIGLKLVLGPAWHPSGGR